MISFSFISLVADAVATHLLLIRSPLFFYLFDVINIPLGCIAVVGNEGMSINYHERHHLFSSFSFMLFGFPQQQVRVARRREEGAGSQTNPSINYL
jgi:hypothetical protein